LSYIAPTQSFHRAGLVGFASKGPFNIPTLITNVQQLAQVFGYPHPESGDPYMIYAAQQYLLVGSELYCVRVGDQDNVSDEQAQTASVAVPSAGGQIQILASKAGPYTFGQDSFFRWRLNGVLHSKTLVVLAGTYNASQLAEDLNLQVDAEIDGISFYYDSTSTYIGVQTTWAFGPDSSFEFVSVQDAMYGDTIVNGNPTGWGTGMTAASLTGSADRYPTSYQTAGQYNLAGLTGLNIQIVVDGTDNVLIDNVVQVIDLSSLEGSQVTIAQVVNEINSQSVDNGGTLPGGWLAVATGNNLSFQTKTTGRDAQLLIKADSTAGAIFGLSNLTVTGTSPQGASNDAAVATYGIIDGAANTTGAVTFTITADSAGIDGNATQVVVTNNVQEGNWVMQVYNNGGQVESWGGLTKDQTSSFYIETFLALVSDWIRVTDNTANQAPPLDGTYSLSGGSDGIPADPDAQDALIIGNQLSYTGLYALSEPEQIDKGGEGGGSARRVAHNCWEEPSPLHTGCHPFLFDDSQNCCASSSPSSSCNLQSGSFFTVFAVFNILRVGSNFVIASGCSSPLRTITQPHSCKTLLKFWNALLPAGVNWSCAEKISFGTPRKRFPVCRHS
jgi:hypothetical protein